MSLPLLKIPLLLIAAVCVRVALTPPTPPVTPEERKYYDDERGRPKDNLSRFQIGTSFKWVANAFIACSECYIILAESYPSLRSTPVLSFLLPASAQSQVHKIGTTPSFLLGVFLIYAGSSIRMICFRHMGRYFTFQLSFKKDHKLITDGPYAYVRHPSYTGSLLMFVGIFLSQMGAGSWFGECGLWSISLGWKVSAVLWILLYLVTAEMLISRTWKEDEVLRGEFGKQWDEWARKTPYRLVPLVF